MKNITAIVTPTWNNEDYTIRCFDSIQKNTKDYKIIWVDNGSSLESRDKVKNFLDKNKVPYELILNKENLGFVKATNQGMKRAVELGTKYIVLQNNDTEVYAGWLDRFIKIAESNSRIGLVGPITSPCDSWQSIDNLRTTHADFSDLPKYKNNPEEYSKIVKDNYKESILETKTQLAFFSVFIKKGVVDEIGFLSEEFGVGFGDDDDYCIRAMQKEWKLFLAKDVFVFHNHRTTFKSIYSQEKINKMLLGNSKIYLDKHQDFIENNQNKLVGFDKNKHTLITFIAHSADNIGGSEKSLLELIDGLRRTNKFYSTVILSDHGTMEEELKKRSVYYEIIPYRWWTIKKGEDDEGAKIDNEIINSLPRIVDVIGKINPDLIYTNTSVINIGALVAMIINKPHVWHIREFGEKDHGINFLYNLPERARYIVNNSNHVIFNSKAVSRCYLEHIESKNTSVVYNNVNIIDSSSEKDNIFQKKDSFKLVVVGGVQEGKGQKDAILAVGDLFKKGIKNIELLFVGKIGELEYEQELKNIIKSKKLENNIKFVGYKKNIHDVISAADIVLVCSRNEAFGRVTAESMLLKKPVIGTNTGGTEELIVDKSNGLLYKSGSYLELSEKIKYLIDNPQKRRDIGIEGFHFAKKTFSDEQYSKKIAKIMTSSIKQHRVLVSNNCEKDTLTLKLLNRIGEINENNLSNNSVFLQKENEIALIKTSKFWKLRNDYIYLKEGLRFALFSPVKFIKKYTTTKK
jgi:L-malate glycosyltransferase